MKKQIMFVLVLAILVAGGVFAQDANSHNNWASGEVGLIGAGLRYERMLNDQWSVGGNVFFNSFFFFWNSFCFEAFGRYYPWGKNFYVEAGLGFGTVSATEKFDYSSDGFSASGEWWATTSGLMITPGVGWKIDLGEPGSFYINPSVTIPIVFGKIDNHEYNGREVFKGGFNAAMNFKAAFGMGYAF